MSWNHLIPVVLLPLAAACAGRPAPAAAPAARTVEARPPQVTDWQVSLGRQVYNGRGNCRYCHGADGRGTVLGPSLVDSIWIQGDGSYQSLVERVMHGAVIHDSTRLPMPERRVTDLRYPEVSAVAAYVWSLQERP